VALNKRLKAIFSLAVAILLPVFFISACNGFGLGGDPPPSGPSQTAILAPVYKDAGQDPAQVPKVLVGSPVQIHSAHPGSNISRVELLVQAANQESAELLRADIPSNGIVLQEWTPDQPGLFTIDVVAYNKNNQQVNPLSIQIEAIESSVVSVAPAQPQQTGDQGAAFAAPTATPTPQIDIAPTEIKTTPISTTTPSAAQADAEDAVVAVAATPETMERTPTAVPRFPPPPPIPGVPPGPTQDQLPELMPPVCDAAKYIEPFVPNTSERVTITEPDNVPAQTVGGTLVHRAWRIQNIGTCTWGPGYELAFYGGRSMGSGGVAFDAFFPDEPDRKNIVANKDRLVAPEGKPNQVAVVEVLLQAPVTPGIHQSYWRMRNPHGVFFGPIVGVTLEVVRDCEFGIYGAPVINRFEILGVGDVFRPADPINVRAELGEPVTLDWSIINADNYDIIVRDPVGNTANLGTNNRTDRNGFIPRRLGQHTIILFADNGPCTATAEVMVDVLPPEDEQFRLIIIHAGASSAADNQLQSSSAVEAGDVKVEWNHFDDNTDEFVLFAELYERRDTQSCYNVFGYEFCLPARGDWKLVRTIQTDVGGTGDAQGAATVTNVEQNLCRSVSDLGDEYEIRYVLRAGKDGRPASPEWSNVVVDDTRTCNTLRRFREEISPQGNAPGSSNNSNGAAGPTDISSVAFAGLAGLILVWIIFALFKR